jgi:hypothetical protein
MPVARRKPTKARKSAPAKKPPLHRPVTSAYPVGLTVDYPAKPLDKPSVFFRPILAIPIFILLGMLLSGGSGVQVSVMGFVTIPTLLMLLFRRKYPKWWFDWNRELAAFALRVTGYCLLLFDEYPSTDAEQSVHLRLPYPKAESELNRWLPLVKWFLAIPHYFILAVLFVAAMVVVVLAWFAVLFTGRFPRGMFDFVVGVMRWDLRVGAYAILLTTDQYPPFTLEE